MTSASCPKQRYLSSGLQVRPFLERRGTERLQRPIWIWPLARSRTGHVMRGRMVGLKPQDMTTTYHNSNCSWQDWMAGTFLGCPWLLLNSIFILDIYIYILYIYYIYIIYIIYIYVIAIDYPKNWNERKESPRITSHRSPKGSLACGHWLRWFHAHGGAEVNGEKWTTDMLKVEATDLFIFLRWALMNHSSLSCRYEKHPSKKQSHGHSVTRMPSVSTIASIATTKSRTSAATSWLTGNPPTIPSWDILPIHVGRVDPAKVPRLMIWVIHGDGFLHIDIGLDGVNDANGCLVMDEMGALGAHNGTYLMDLETNGDIDRRSRVQEPAWDAVRLHFGGSHQQEVMAWRFND